MVEADRIVVVALVPDIAVAYGLLVVVVISVLDIAAEIVSVADDTAGIEAAVGIVVGTMKYEEKCVREIVANLIRNSDLQILHNFMSTYLFVLNR